MAERRMFAKAIIDSDAFLDMPLSAQCLYFHLSMRADDDGFINNPKKIQRMVGAMDDDLRILIARKFIIPFESGIVVIKHWKIHNYIRSDRYKETVYQEEKAMLSMKENHAYTMMDTTGIPLGIPTDNQMDTQVRLGKDRIELGKDSIVVEDAPQRKSTRFTPPTLEEVTAYCFERGNNVDPQRFIDYYTSNGWMVGRNKMKDWKATVRNWEKKDNDRPAQKPVKINDFHKFQQHDYDMDAIERMLDLQDIAEVEAMRKGGG